MIPAGETDGLKGRVGAEGATAPEPLRQKDRRGDEALESSAGGRLQHLGHAGRSPKE